MAEQRIIEVGERKGVGFVIKEIFVAISVMDDGDEGVPAVKTGDTLMPLVAADPERLEWMRSFAAMIEGHTGVPIKIKRFVLVEEE